MLSTFSKNFAKDIPSSTSANQAPSKSSNDFSKQRDVRYIFSLIVFIISIIFTIGIFGINIYLDEEIIKVSSQVVGQESVIQSNTITNLVLFDKQVRTLKVLNMSRSGYSVLIDELSAIVVPGVRYASMTISLESKGEYLIAINGVAESLSAYLQQIQVLSTTERLFKQRARLTDYVVSRDNIGNTSVSFSLNITIPISVVTLINTS